MNDPINTCDKGAIDDRFGIILDRFLFTLNMLCLQVHPEAGQGEDLLGSLLTLGNLALLLIGGGQGGEPGHLIHV